MEQTNKKHLLPGFNTAFPTQFAGLQNQGTNAFMSTLQTLQMQNLASSSNFTAADMSQWQQSSSQAQQTWIDPAKVAAMLPMYANCFPAMKTSNTQNDLNQFIQQNGTYDTNALQYDSTQGSIFPTQANINSLTQQNAAGSSQQTTLQSSSLFQEAQMNLITSAPSTSNHNDILDTAVQLHNLFNLQPQEAAQLQQSVLQQTLQPDLLNQTLLHQPVSQHLSQQAAQSQEEIRLQLQQAVQNIVQPNVSLSAPVVPAPKASFGPSLQFSLPQPSLSKASTSVNDSLGMAQLRLGNGTLARPTPNCAEISAAVDDWLNQMNGEVSQKSVAPEAEEVKKEPDESKHVDDLFFSNQPQDDVVDTLFTMVDPISDVSSNLFDMTASSSAQAPLSPVQFTPPDSPTGILTNAELFGIPTPKKLVQNCAPSTSGISATKTIVHENPPQSSFKIPELPPAMKPKKDPIYARTVVKSTKVPVYKQRMSAFTATKPDDKKEDKEDEYSFDDEEAGPSLLPLLKQKEPEAILSSESRSKYVPGIGFAITVDGSTEGNKTGKRRTYGERHNTTGQYLQQISDSHHQARVVDPDFVTLAEQIRRRNNQRLACTFLTPELSNSTECAKEVGKPTSLHPPLPKLIIKIQRKASEVETKPLTKNGKKRGRRKKIVESDEDDDSDWEGSAPKKRGRRGRKSTEKFSYEVKLVEKPREPLDSLDSWDRVQNTGNKRGLKDSRLGANNQVVSTDSVRYRLSKFGSAEGHLPKGTFVVNKADVLKPDCALWKVDNQNLLQKFPPRLDHASKGTVYKNSSTYSGWCEQISSHYYRVSVRVIKQSRSETIIVPEIPLQELFPAMSTECFDSSDSYGYTEPSVKHVDESIMLRDPLKEALHTYTQAVLTHAINLEYLQVMEQKNDWTFLRAVTDIDKVNEEMVSKIRDHVKLGNKYDDTLKEYIHLVISENEYFSSCCQYDAKTLQLENEKDKKDEKDEKDKKPEKENSGEKPAVEIMMCETCANAFKYLHRMHHIKLHLLKRCEDRLEFWGTRHPEYTPEKVLDTVRKDRPWLHALISEYADMFSYEVKLVEKPREPMDSLDSWDRVQNTGNKKGLKDSRRMANNQVVSTDSVRYRLSKFGSAEGHLPKGTFVVNKADVLKPDCALWKKDNQNLLQKFPPQLDHASKGTVYKNSSTYSGWCEQISSHYYRVSVRVIKQSRSETIIVPEIPLQELFPAMSTECFDSSDSYGYTEPSVKHVDESIMLRDPLKKALLTYTQAVLTLAINLEYLQMMEQKNDWTFLRVVTDIDEVNEEMVSKIRDHVKLGNKYDDTLKEYIHLVISENEYFSSCCQACGKRNAQRIAHLFCRMKYDAKTLQLENEKDKTDKKDEKDKKPEKENSGEKPAVEIMMCETCANAFKYLHRMHHIKLHLLKRCEDRLEFWGTRHPEYTPEKVLDTVRKDRPWLHALISEYADMWRRIRLEY
ncbi:unnamed protein product [Caenorhabditis auriculariae]|uniref:Uncharacterized protein n=1 Tax=Caenorhabditis auriculariae TaxID=2777116 RepID=A0A8S1GW03_9PELO|nr:unnamed protein product [Caenorhabditis auriculariae]